MMLSGITKRFLLACVAALAIATASHAQGGQYSTIQSSPEPLPNCTPAAQGQLQPVIWDTTAQQMMTCSEVNTWTQLGGVTPAGPPGTIQQDTAGALGASPLFNNGTTVVNSESSAVAGNETVTGNACFGGPRPYIDVTCPPYNAQGDGGALFSSAVVTGGNPVINTTADPGWVVGMGVFCGNCGAGGTAYYGKITAVSGFVHLTVTPTPSTSQNPALIYDDDTVALSAAFTAACASTIGLTGSRPTVSLPPGSYTITHADGSSTTPVLPNCFGFKISGPPSGTAVITEGHRGLNPNPAAAFSVPNNFECTGISFQGYNQALVFNTVANVGLSGCGAQLVTSTPTGLAGNEAVDFIGTFEMTWKGGYISSDSTTVPNFVLEDNPGTGQPSYLIDMEDLSLGPGTDVFNENGACVSLPAGYTFKNIVREYANSDFLSFVQASSYGCAYTGLFLQNVQDADNDDGSAALINFDQPNGTIGGAQFLYNLANSGIAIRDVASVSPVANIDIRGAFDLTNQVVDGSGNVTGDAVETTETGSGRDFIDDSVPASLTGVPVAGLYTPLSNISQRFFGVGSPYSTLGLSGSLGILLGDGSTVASYTGQIRTTAPAAIDIGFPTLLPPSSFTGTATTGGSLSPGTYYAVIWATANTNCTLTGSSFSGWAYGPAAGIAVGAPNNAVNFTWTASAASPVAPVGYCISMRTGSFVNIYSLGNTGDAYYISGASTTSFLYTGQAQTLIGNVINYPVMQARHRFAAELPGGERHELRRI